jgi:uncharacterized membrane protein YfcA
MNRLAGAMIAYALLAALTLATISDSRIRGVTLVILAMFAVKSWLRRKDVMHPNNEEVQEPGALAESRRPIADGRVEPM